MELTRRDVLKTMLAAGVGGLMLTPAGPVYTQFAYLAGCVLDPSKPFSVMVRARVRSGFCALVVAPSETEFESAAIRREIPADGEWHDVEITGQSSGIPGLALSEGGDMALEWFRIIQAARFSSLKLARDALDKLAAKPLDQPEPFDLPALFGVASYTLDNDNSYVLLT